MIRRIASVVATVMIVFAPSAASASESGPDCTQFPPAVQEQLRKWGWNC